LWVGCEAPYCDTPLRGGVKITYPGVTACTSGFVAFRVSSPSGDPQAFADAVRCASTLLDPAERTRP